MDLRKTAPVLAVFSLLALLVPRTFAETLQLPNQAPIPEVNAPPAGNIAPRRLGDVPVPEPRPDAPGRKEPAAPVEPPAVDAPQETPLTTPLPQKAPTSQKPAAKPEGSETPPAPPPDPRSAEAPALQMPLAEMTCRQRLQTLGVSFRNRPAQADASGCAMPYPVSVKTLGDGVAMEPEALMNCAMADAAARFTAEVIAPTAKREFGTELKSISQASAYVCRPRNGTAKLSEHAFGNALDIASFKLSDGKVVDVILRPEEQAARFLGALRKAACGPFKTVLGPGSNADHATHFHLDLAPRRHGGTVCE